MTETIAEISENKKALAESVEEIRANPDLNDNAKQRLISGAYEEAARRHGELVARREEEAAGELAQLERAVFALSYPERAATEQQKETFRLSYRDAAFRI